MGRLLFFLRINIRNLFTNKKFALVNIIGLSVGVTVSLLILLYIRYETSFDNFNPDAENIYRIVTKNIQDGTIGASTPLALSDVLKKDYPEIKSVVGLMSTYNDLKVGEERFENIRGAVVEKEFFSLFNFPLITGNQGILFEDPFEVVITRNLAEKLYGTIDALGRTFEYEDFTFTVTGIINDIPSNSIFDFEYFLSDNFRYKYFPDIAERWYHFGLFTFITFNGNKVPSGFEQKLTGIEKQYYPDFMKTRSNYLIVDFKGSHLNPLLENDIVPGVNPSYLWILSIIAFGILVIACLNFMNISIATAGKRSIETVIKKASGASPGNLIGDFFAEIAFLVVISLMISFFGIYLLLPFFNNMIDKNIVVDLSDSILWYGVTGFGMLSILISGLYPAIVLSRPSPVKILLHNKEADKNKMTFQKSFVVLQFTITIILGITQIFIFKQISFMKNHETGFDKQNLITILVRSLGNYGNERMNNTTLFVQTLEKYQSQYGYGKASVTEFVPGFGFRNNFKIYPENSEYPDGMELLSCDIDENFRDVFGLKILNGRFFSKEYSTDYDAILINESAWKKLGWKSLEGKSVGLFAKDNRKEVVGVINDINVRSLQYPVQPMIYQFGRHHNYPGYVTIRINTDKKSETIDFIKKQWTELFPGIPFGVESVDEKYRNAYGAEQKLAKITGMFSILAIFLSLMGIFALSTLEAEKRIKEVGIRKINGAKVSEVMSMFNKDFGKWVILAYIIGCPGAWFVMNKWMQNFAYKTELNWWVFAFAGMIILGLAMLTISWQSFRVATRNPVEALRYE
ncbi:MAG TPA: ABC transporter permease [Bacteroidales bacterium]|nr:ABC transporter permease [Bacteroidales bacterium]